MNSTFPNRWSFSYLKFTKYVTNIIAEPKYKYGQQEQVIVRNHNRSTTLEWSVLKYGGGGGGLDRNVLRPTPGDPWGVAQAIETLEQKKTNREPRWAKATDKKTPAPIKIK